MDRGELGLVAQAVSEALSMGFVGKYHHPAIVLIVQHMVVELRIFLQKTSVSMCIACTISMHPLDQGSRQLVRDSCDMCSDENIISVGCVVQHEFSVGLHACK